MWKYSITAVFIVALSACGQGSAEDSGGGAPPTMPELTFSVTEKDDQNEVVMEATVEIAADGSWQRTGTESGSGSLTEEQIAEIDELANASDFPRGPDDGMVCTTEVPPYFWSLTVGEDSVSNGNGGCVDSDSAVEIVGIIQEAADVGATLETDD
ncbi:hypothetical protein [Glycomyces rhizosphaerae]|uniref:Uncharacterized protein n=1 Tax=Glycomyces rhizosphaerae TaxID=2054422 RepID=A0ABV7PYN7_9ACTN